MLRRAGIILNVRSFVAGLCTAQRAVICSEIVGEEAVKTSYGLLVTCQGIGVLLGPPIASKY